MKKETTPSKNEINEVSPERLFKFDAIAKNCIEILDDTEKALFNGNGDTLKKALEKLTREITSMSEKLEPYADMGDKYRGIKRIIARKVRRINQLIEEKKIKNGTNSVTEVTPPESADTQPVLPDDTIPAKRATSEDVLEIPFDSAAKKKLLDLGQSKEKIEENLELMREILGVEIEKNSETPDNLPEPDDKTKAKITYLEEELERQKKLLVHVESLKDATEEEKERLKKNIALTQQTIDNLKHTGDVQINTNPETIPPTTPIPVVSGYSYADGGKPASVASTPASTPETPKSEYVASVPIMITRDQRQQLLDLGLNNKEIDGLKPVEAKKILERGVKKPKTEPKFFSALADWDKEARGEEKLSKSEGDLPTPIPTTELAPAREIPLEAKDFIDKLGLEPLLPKEFGRLKEEQKVKVITDLKRRIVDIVKSDAQTQYSETLKEKNGIKRYFANITKEKNIKNLEVEIFKKLKETTEGKELIKQDLEVLTQKASQKPIYIDFEGNPEIIYIDTLNSHRRELVAGLDFNRAANEFTKIPYEWGQEKSGKHKKAYDKARLEYETAEENILKARIQEKQGDKNEIFTEILEIDNAVKMEQLLNTHPEFEKELNDFERSGSGMELARTGKKFLESATLERLGLLVGGAGARTLAKGVAVFSGATIITAIAAPIVGGAVGYLRGKFRAKDELIERKKGARHGKKDESKEATNIENAENLNTRMITMLEAVENAPTREQYEKKLDQIKRRIEYTQGKLVDGLVNFGDSKTALNNQFNLINNLNRALVVSASLEETTRKDIDERLERFLSYKDEKISKARKEFIKKQARKGMIYGASFALAGYGARALGEHFGWWGNNGEETLSQKSETTPVGTTSEPTLGAQAPEAVNPAEVTAQPEGINPTEVTTPTEIPLQAFHNECVTFEKGKGGIQGIWELKNQIRKQYDGDYSQAPQSVQDFMNTDATKEAIKLGLFDPENESGKESALIQEGSMLKFDKDGNILFGKPDANGNIPILEKYTGKMFDSDKSAGTPPTESKPDGERMIKMPENVRSYQKIVEVGSVEKGTPENISPESALDKETKTEIIRKQIFQNIEKNKPNTIRTGTTIGVGNTMQSSRGEGGINYNYDSGFRHMGGPQFYFPGVSPRENDFLNQNWGFFGGNPYHLTGTQLIHTYDFFSNTMRHYLTHGGTEKDWMAIKNVGAKEFLNQENINPAHKPIKEYLGKLAEITKPRGGFLRRAETIESYMSRAIQKAIREGKLEQFEKSLGR